MLGVLRVALVFAILLAPYSCAAAGNVNVSAWEFRLIDGGMRDVAGRFEMRPNASAPWGGICSTGYNKTTAQSSCREFGYDVQFIYAVFDRAPLQAGTPMYLGDVSCTDPEHSITGGCSWMFSEGGEACATSDAVLVDCRTGTSAPTLPPSYTFYAVFQPLVTMTLDDVLLQMKNQIAMFYGDKDDTFFKRINVVNSSEYTIDGGNTKRFNVSFEITDRHNENGLSKRFVEETLIADRAKVFGTDIGLVSLTSDLPPAPPLATHDTSGWAWRVNGTERGHGRLEVNPAGAWGTVCGTGFGDPEAFAACGSVGYPNPPHAIPLTFYGGGHGTIFLSDARCAYGQLFLSDCEFTLSTADDIRNYCSHTEDVGINCAFNSTLPPDSTILTYSPDHLKPTIGWVATMFNSAYATEELFIIALADTLGGQDDPIPTDRIVIENVHSDDVYTYVSFSFTRGTPSDAPATDFDAVLDEADPIMLEIVLDFVELTNNASGTTMPPTTATTWDAKLSDGTKGLILVQPSTGGGWGTVCDQDFGRDGAMAACLTAGIDHTDAVVIPGFTPTIEGQIYFDQVTCPQGQTFDQCTKRVSMPGDTKTTCTHQQDAGAICFNSTTTVPPNADEHVCLFKAFLQSGRVDLPIIAQTLDAFIPFDERRLVLTHVDFQESSGITVIDFFIADVLPNTTRPQPPREAIEYWMQHISASQRVEHFNFFNLDWTYGKPVLPPRPKQHDLTGWTFKLATESKKGLLLARPPGDTKWGGVCGLHFNVEDSVAMCRYLGFDTDYALPFTYGDDINVVLSEVSCPDPAPGVTLSSCVFTTWNSSNLNMDCPRLHAVSLDCLPDAGFRAPVEFTAVVKAAGYDAANFSGTVAGDCNISASRIKLGELRTNGEYNYVNFEFLDDSTVDGHTTSRVFSAMGAIPPPVGPGVTTTPEGEGDGSFTGSFGHGFGSLSGVMPLYGAPRAILERVLREILTPTVLFKAWGIYELRSNITQPNGAINPDKSSWRFKLVNLLNDTAAAVSPYGRMEMQAGSPNAPWGTVDCRRFDHSDALVACRTVLNDPSVTTALAVPFFVQPGQGIIYLSGVACTDSAASDLLTSCTYNASTRYDKKNNATHDEDVGLICGRGVVPDSPTPIQYRMGFNPETEPLAVTDLVASRFADLMKIPSSRVQTKRYYDDAVLEVIVEVTFAPPTREDEPTVGDADLFAQSINGWGLFEIFGAVSFEFTSSIVPDHPSPGSTPAPPFTPAPPTTLAPPPTPAPPTNATTTETTTAATTTGASTTSATTSAASTTSTTTAAPTTATTTTTASPTTATSTTTGASTTSTTTAASTTSTTTAASTTSTTTTSASTTSTSTSASTTSTTTSTTTDASTTATTTTGPVTDSTTTTSGPTTTTSGPTLTSTTEGPTTATTMSTTGTSPTTVTTTGASTTTSATTTTGPSTTTGSSTVTTTSTTTPSSTTSPTTSSASPTTATETQNTSAVTSPTAPPTTTASTTAGPTTTSSSTAPSSTPAPTDENDRLVTIAYDASLTESEVLARIDSVLIIDGRDYTVVSSDAAKHEMVLEFRSAGLAERAVNTAKSKQARDEMGVVTMAAANDGPEGPPSPPEEKKDMLMYYAAAGGGGVLLLVVIGIVVVFKRTKKPTQYHDEYVQMSAMGKDDEQPLALNRV